MFKSISNITIQEKKEIKNLENGEIGVLSRVYVFYDLYRYYECLIFLYKDHIYVDSQLDWQFNNFVLRSYCDISSFVCSKATIKTINGDILPKCIIGRNSRNCGISGMFGTPLNESKMNRFSRLLGLFSSYKDKFEDLIRNFIVENEIFRSYFPEYILK